MVGKTALNKEMKHLNGAYFRTILQYEKSNYTLCFILAFTLYFCTKL
jgi:hypothetical protein